MENLTIFMTRFFVWAGLPTGCHGSSTIGPLLAAGFAKAVRGLPAVSLHRPAKTTPPSAGRCRFRLP